MSTKINVSPDTLHRLKTHIHDGSSVEDIIIKLLDFEDQYGAKKPLEFEVEFDERLIKVFRLNNDMIEYFTPARKFSVTLSDWNLPDEFYDEWISFITNSEVVPVLLDLDENILECGCFMIRKI